METQETLTDRQTQVLYCIRETLRADGAIPTFREIGRKVGIKSVGVVARHIDILVEKGYLRKDKRRARSLAPVGMDVPDWVGVPMAVPTVPGGCPKFINEECEAFPESYLWFDRRWLRLRDAFALRIKGDSMKDAGIRDGDTVLIKRQSHADPGDVVVAVVGGGATLKRYCPEKDAIYLKPANEAFDPIRVPHGDAEFRIVGKAVKRFGVVR
ncbi:MAG: repressor LexA [Elusimicrobia bacterium]|nr:repressor LexA [Elusimicrobiota bacterium]